MLQSSKTTPGLGLAVVFAVALAATAWAPLMAGTANGSAASAPELLARSIAHHDPEGVWGRSALTLVFEESRPDGETRRTKVSIDPAEERFAWSSRREGRVAAGRLVAGVCETTLDGVVDFSDDDAEKYGLTCDTLARRRDYYAYLWGLPMKLRDPGTRIDPTVERTEFQGRKVLALKVTYDEAVGSDTWYLYFDPATAALAGYRFFHDESANDGEYITLDGEARVGSLRLPKTRAWYYNDGDGYLGTDTLVEGLVGTAP